MMTILKQLIMVQIVQQQKQEEEEQEALKSYPETFFNPPRSVRPIYQRSNCTGEESKHVQGLLPIMIKHHRVSMVEDSQNTLIKSLTLKTVSNMSR